MEDARTEGGRRPSIAVIILNWNTREHTLECLESLEKTRYPKEYLGLFVTDNGSTDGSQEAIQAKLAAMADQGWHELALVENGKNLGFCGGNNAAYARVGGEYHLVHLSNDDMVYFEDTFDQLVEVLEQDERTGVVGPKVLCYSDPEQLSHGAGLVETLLCGTRSVDATEPIACDYVTGCALCIRRSVIDQLGFLLDEEFFAYWEDTDLCARVRELGFKVMYCPQAKVLHKVGTALPQSPQGAPSPAKVYYVTHSKYIYARRHLTPLARIGFHLLFLARVPFFVLKTFARSPRKTPALTKAYLLAMGHGIMGRPGQKYPG